MPDGVTIFLIRITPAGAGKTIGQTEPSNVSSDHPRRCGENYEKLRKAKNIEGSPPQVRGKLYRAAGIAEKYRITPAGAGKTDKKQALLDTVVDHPRRCGENVEVKIRKGTFGGSPPQVRGKPQYRSPICRG